MPLFGAQPKIGSSIPEWESCVELHASASGLDQGPGPHAYEGREKLYTRIHSGRACSAPGVGDLEATLEKGVRQEQIGNPETNLHETKEQSHTYP